MTKLSVIIPYHNVEQYLKHCLDSVVNQTLTDIEIICINDASTDGSEKIVRDYANSDSRIKMLNIEHLSGQAYARNLGLSAAQGEYIGFVDSDDWIETSMFEKMYNKAKEQNAEITMCQASLYDDETGVYSTNDYYNLKCLEKFNSNLFKSEDTKDEILSINVVLWNKIYKREFLTSIGACFINGFIYEDLPFFFSIYLKAQNINIVWEHLYYYRQNRRYSTMQNNDKKVFDRIPMVSMAYESLKQTSFYKEKETEILSWIIDDIFHRYTLLEEKYYKEYFYMMKKLFKSFDLTEEEKAKLDTCYCYDEFCNILKNNYFDFWKFLIEKYKTSNKVIKTLKHENNKNVAAVMELWDKYKVQKEQEIDEINKYFQNEITLKEETIQSLEKKYSAEKEELINWHEKTINEKEEIISWWQNHCEEEEKKYKEEYDKLYWDFHSKLIKQEYELKKWQSESVREKEEKLTADFNYKLVKQEYELKKWQSESVREKEEKLTADFNFKLEHQKQNFQKALIKQKEYYEKEFLLVKIEIKIKKAYSQIKNKIKKILKKN